MPSARLSPLAGIWTYTGPIFTAKIVNMVFIRWMKRWAWRPRPNNTIFKDP